MSKHHISLTPILLGKLLLPWWSSSKHIEKFEEEFLKLYFSPNLNRLIVSVPVRHSKTTYFGVLVPLWALLMNPSERVIIASHSLTFSAEQVSRVRDLIGEYGATLTGTSLDENCSRGQHFRLRNSMGECRAVGVSSSCAGMTASLIILDDPYPDNETAASATQRTKLEHWVGSELLTRETPCAGHPPKTIVIASRRHPSDITANLISNNNNLTDDKKWHHIEYKAIQDDNTALWPEMFPLEKLQAIRAEYDIKGHGYIFDGLYQQNPATNPETIEYPESYFADESLWYDNLPTISSCVTTGGIDIATGRSEGGDYSVCVHIVCGDNKVYVQDSLLVRCPVSEFELQASEFFLRNNTDAILCETNIETDFMTRLNNVVHGRLPLNGVFHTKPKEVRIRRQLSGLLMSHNIHFRNTPNNRLLVQQIRELFSGKYDDGPDALATALEMKQTIRGEVNEQF